MLRLSLTLTDDRTWRCLALLGRQRFEPAFFHPYDAESVADTAFYRDWLFAQLANPHCRTYRDAYRICQAHLAGQTVILRLHENSHHGDVLLAALLSFAETLPLAPAGPGRAGNHAHLPLVPDEIEEQATELDPRRFVWILAKDGSHAKLGYIYDTEGVITALVPGFGLVPLGRLPTKRLFDQRNRPLPYDLSAHPAKIHNLEKKLQAKKLFWRNFPSNYWLHRPFKQIAARLIVAGPADAGRNEKIFVELLKRQREQERVINERTTSPNADRYSVWHPAEVDCLSNDDLPPLEEEHRAEVAAFLRFHAILGDDPAAYEPAGFQGEHVRPVYQTRADGSLWVLPVWSQRPGLPLFYVQVKPATQQAPALPDLSLSYHDLSDALVKLRDRIAVVNLKHCPEGAINLTHLHNSPLANPFPITAESQRPAALAAYQTWLAEQLESNTPARRALYRLAHRVLQGERLALGCTCAPRPCHVDVVKNFVLRILATLAKEVAALHYTLVALG